MAKQTLNEQMLGNLNKFTEALKEMIFNNDKSLNMKFCPPYTNGYICVVKFTLPIIGPISFSVGNTEGLICMHNDTFKDLFTLEDIERLQKLCKEHFDTKEYEEILGYQEKVNKYYEEMNK